MEKRVYTQKEMKEMLIPVLKSEGKLYKKEKDVMARKAKPGERIDTVTNDGKETSNTAKTDNFIIKNQTEAGEMYIISESKFKERYEWKATGENDFDIYKAKGKVLGIEMTSSFLEKMGFDQEFYFIAPWNEEMVVKKEDFLVTTPNYSEIYRIARKEFFETYQLEK